MIKLRIKKGKLLCLITLILINVTNYPNFFKRKNRNLEKERNLSISKPEKEKSSSVEPRIHFLKDFKSPCLYIGDRLRCFPFYFLIGPQKCGTSDVSNRLNLHPDIVPPEQKETSFFTLKHRRPIEKILLPPISNSSEFLPAFGKYFGNFLPLVRQLNKCIDARCKQLISGDASAGTIWESYIINEEMKKMSNASNQPYEEFSYLEPNLIMEYLPKTKFLTLLRNPVERVFSDFKFFSHWKQENLSIRRFDKLIKKRIEEYENCTLYNDSRYCAYSLTRDQYDKTASVTLGLYCVFLKDWFRIVPRDQLFIERFEDYATDEVAVLSEMFKFLEVRPVDDETMTSILAVKKLHVGVDIGSMLPSTRKKLENFYAQCNQQLAESLEDERFLWN